MFSKTDSNSERETSRAAAGSSGTRNSAPSIISANLHIVGNLKTDGEIQVDGVIEGDVVALSLTVGAHARISGELTTQEVVVHGHISGKITSKTVRLAKTAKVIGDIVHDVLAIEAGAHIEGQLKRISEADKPPRKAEITAPVVEAKLAGTNGKEKDPGQPSAG